MTDAANMATAVQQLSNGAPKELPLLKDLPVQNPKLGYERYVETLASIVCGGANAVDNTPITIGLFAPWGSGKSTLLRGLENAIRQDYDDRSVVVNFNAWHHERSENLAADLVCAMGDAVSMAAEREAQSDHGLAGVDTADFIETDQDNRAKALASGLKKAGTMLKGVGIEFLKHTHVKASLGIVSVDATAYDLAQSAVQSTSSAKESDGSETSTSSESPAQPATDNDDASRIDTALDKVSTQLHDLNRRIVVMIDDLDRCTPEGIVQAVETINTLTGRPGMIFILALDHDYIVNAVERHYSQQGSVLNGEKYLEKIIQIPFWIPSPEFDSVDSVPALLGEDNWTKIKDQWLESKLEGDLRDIIQGALRSNPRQTKRFVNSFLMLSSMYWEKLHREYKSIDDHKAFLYFLGLQVAWPTLYARMLTSIDRLPSNEVGKSGSLNQLDIVQGITNVCGRDEESSTNNGDGDAKGSSDGEASASTTRNDVNAGIENLKRQYGVAFADAEDLERAYDYLDKDVFSSLSAEDAKGIMKMAATGSQQSGTVPSSSPDMSKRDTSKWYWNGDHSRKFSKYTVLKAILERFRQQPDNIGLDRETFAHRFGDEILAAIGQKTAAKLSFDPQALLSVCEDGKVGEDDHPITFAGDNAQYTLDWWCGFGPTRSVGSVVHRPVIEHFRDKRGYPIVQA